MILQYLKVCAVVYSVSTATNSTTEGFSMNILKSVKRSELLSQKFGSNFREIRTRTPITRLKKVPDASKKNEAVPIDHIEPTKKNNNDENGNTLSALNKQKRSRFSKFSSDNISKQPDANGSTINEIMRQMNFKKPQQIINELTNRFEKDGIEVDREFIEKMVKESNKEQEMLAEYIKNPQATLSKVNEDEINIYVDWLIEDGSNRIKNQSKDIYEKKVKMRSKLNEFILNNNTEEDQDPENLTNAFIMAQELSNLNSESSLDKLPIFLKHITKLTNSELQNSINLNKIASLYEISTQIINPSKREICIYLSGKLLYQALKRELGPRARPDPINEKFFIESCINFGDLETALSLYNSRKEKDVKNERFWSELGISIYMARYSSNLSDSNESLNQAIQLVHDVREKWGFVNNSVLIDSVKKCCIKNNFDDAFWFWEDIQLNIDEFGIQKEIEKIENQFFDEKDKDQVFNFYNKIEPISNNELIQCIFMFISSLQFEKGFEILKYIVLLDNNFIYEFIKEFGIQFKYSGRELFLIELENDTKSENPKYLSNIRDYLIEEIKPLQKSRCFSFEEAKVLEDINIYLERLSKLRNKNLGKINDLQEIIQSGEKLTSFEIKNLLNILLEHKSVTSFQLACKIINQMNVNKVNNILDSIFPIANSFAYMEFCKQFLNESNPRVKEINDFLQMMVTYDIKLDQNLANQIIISYISKRMYSEAVKFIETYLFTDNPIAINNIRIKNDGNKNLWITAFIVYYKSVVSGSLSEELFNSRLESLQNIVKNLMKENIYDEFTIQEAISTLLAYGDYQTSLCLIEWYGLNNSTQEGKIKFKFVLALKGRFETSISKAEKYLKHSKKSKSEKNFYLDRIKQYRQKFGVQSLQEDLKTERDFTWQEVAMVLYRYAELFCFKSTYSKEDPFSLLISDEDRNNLKLKFDTSLSQLQQYYHIPEWKP